MFCCIPVLPIWKHTKHNGERDLWFCLCFLHLLSGFGQVGKKCKESQGWNNLYLNGIVSFKRHCSFFIHCLSFSNWTATQFWSSYTFFPSCTCYICIYTQFQTQEMWNETSYLSLLDDNIKSIWKKVLQRFASVYMQFRQKTRKSEWPSVIKGNSNTSLHGHQSFSNGFQGGLLHARNMKVFS